ncbi:MAG: succinylglutamate desuccinylase/aspartoacylase family protein [Thiogranum sp.]|jgi:predicted deacylase
MNELIIGGRHIRPGERETVNLPLALLHTQTPLEMPVKVWRGRKDGPRLFVSAAIHGDELNGVEIIRRLLQHRSLAHLHGSLITIPTVNVYGVIHHSRYLPDRRDLNRSFPGSERGSLAGRLANLFMSEIVHNCTHGIDLHTGALHRSNLPQLRVNLEDPEIETLARAFGVPVIINSDLRDGSLREAATESGVHMLLYEAGEALRFDELSIRAGVKGIISVMRTLGMLPKKRYTARTIIDPLIAWTTQWVRAPGSGIFRAYYTLGQAVRKKDVLGIIASPFGDREEEVIAPGSGIVIGRSTLPLINEGDALFHIARFRADQGAAESVEVFSEVIADPEAPPGEPPIL